MPEPLSAERLAEIKTWSKHQGASALEDEILPALDRVTAQRDRLMEALVGFLDNVDVCIQCGGRRRDGFGVNLVTCSYCDGTGFKFDRIEQARAAVAEEQP